MKRWLIGIAIVAGVSPGWAQSSDNLAGLRAISNALLEKGKKKPVKWDKDPNLVPGGAGEFVPEFPGTSQFDIGLSDPTNPPAGDVSQPEQSSDRGAE